MEVVAATFDCAFCGEPVETSVDLSQGASQSYVEDCAVCCRPNVLHVTADLEGKTAWIRADFEG